MKTWIHSNRKHGMLFVLGFLGVLSSSVLAPELAKLSPTPVPISDGILQIVSVLQSSVLLALMVLLGAVFAKRVHLETPLIDIILAERQRSVAIKKVLTVAVVSGVASGVFILIFSGYMTALLPDDFLEKSQGLALPWHTRILYGGITEEILVRWGLMSFFVWGLYRISQKKGQPIGAHNYVLAIFVAALIFAAGHLPMALMLTEEPDFYFFVYIIIGNSAFGCLAGWLFWRFGLECAVIAHMTAHVTMLAFG